MVVVVVFFLVFLVFFVCVNIREKTSLFVVVVVAFWVCEVSRAAGVWDDGRGGFVNVVRSCRE